MSIRVLLRSGLLVATVLIAACAGSPLKSGHPGEEEAASLNHARQALASADMCCTQFSQFDFSKALPDHPKRFQVDDDLPVADFGGARSWFLAFHLPKNADKPYEVLFKSTLSGRWLHHSYLFAPSVAVLDAAFTPLRIEDVQLCEYMGWTQSTSGAFGHLSIENPAARYLVVYTSSQQLSGSTYWEQSPTAFSTEAPVAMAASGSFQIPHGPNGVIYVGKLTDKYRKSVDNAICAKRDPAQGSGVLSTLRKVFLSADHDAASGPAAP